MAWNNIGNMGLNNLNSIGSEMPHVAGSTLLVRVEKTLGTRSVNVYPFQTLSS